MSGNQTDSELQEIVSTFWRRAERATAEDRAEEARGWIEGIVELDDTNIDAWLRLASLVPDPRERMLCYSRVLELAPGHPEARAGIRRARRER
jgi:hypothetical protein